MAPETPVVETPDKTLDYASGTRRPSKLRVRHAVYGALVILTAIAAADVDFVVIRTDYCPLTGSWQTRTTTALFFASSTQRPSALELEATRRGMLVQHAWKQVSESRRSLLSQSVACNTTYPRRPDLLPSELAAMSDQEIQMLVSRPAGTGP